MILLKLFVCFLQIGLFSVGGGYAAMPLIQNQVVDLNGWLTMAEFSDLVTIAEMTPGPILINSATFVGVKLAGIPGAIVATFGVILPACIVSLALVMLFRKYSNLAPVESALLSLKCMALALIASTMVKLGVQAVAPDAPSLDVVYGAYVALVMCGAFYLINQRHLKPLYVMLGCGVVNLVAHLLVF